MTDQPEGPLSSTSLAFLAVGLASLVYLALPAAQPATRVVVHVTVLVAGLLGFREVWTRKKLGPQAVASLPAVPWAVRTLEAASAVVGALIVTGLV